MNCSHHCISYCAAPCLVVTPVWRAALPLNERLDYPPCLTLDPPPFSTLSLSLNIRPPTHLSSRPTNVNPSIHHVNAHTYFSSQYCGFKHGMSIMSTHVPLGTQYRGLKRGYGRLMDWVSCSSWDIDRVPLYRGILKTPFYITEYAIDA